MTDIQFDTGVRSYRMGGGVLKFNPSDPNLYCRFLEAVEELAKLEADFDKGGVAALRELDGQVKTVLQGVFGPENDLEAVFGGLNLLAVGENGHRILENFVSALEPILKAGALRCAREQAEALA